MNSRIAKFAKYITDRYPPNSVFWKVTVSHAHGKIADRGEFKWVPTLVDWLAQYDSDQFVWDVELPKTTSTSFKTFVDECGSLEAMDYGFVRPSAVIAELRHCFSVDTLGISRLKLPAGGIRFQGQLTQFFADNNTDGQYDSLPAWEEAIRQIWLEYEAWQYERHFPEGFPWKTGKAS